MTATAGSAQTGGETSQTGAAMRLSEITRPEARALQGAAILMMLLHHLFGLPTLVDPPAEVWSILPPLNPELWIGRAGKACVGVFLFLSGYGLALRGDLRPLGGVDKGLRFLGLYLLWAVLVWTAGRLIAPDLMVAGRPRFPTEIAPLLGNLLTLRNDFAYEWWFAETYLLLVLLSPLLIRAAGRPRLALALSGLGFLIGAAMDQTGIGLPLLSVANLLIWQVPFVQGVLAAGLSRGPGPARVPTLLIWVALMAGVVGITLIRPALLTPVLILSTPVWVLALRQTLAALSEGARRAFRFLGEHSLPIWLVHPLLCYTFAQPLIYAPRLSPLIFLWLLALTLAIVLPVEALRRRLTR